MSRLVTICQICNKSVSNSNWSRHMATHRPEDDDLPSAYLPNGSAAALANYSQPYQQSYAQPSIVHLHPPEPVYGISRWLISIGAIVLSVSFLLSFINPDFNLVDKFAMMRIENREKGMRQQNALSDLLAQAKNIPALLEGGIHTRDDVARDLAESLADKTNKDLDQTLTQVCNFADNSQPNFVGAITTRHLRALALNDIVEDYYALARKSHKDAQELFTRFKDSLRRAAQRAKIQSRYAPPAGAANPAQQYCTDVQNEFLNNFEVHVDF